MVADRLAPRSLLDELAPDVELVNAAKIPRGRAMAQGQFNPVLIDRARQGRFVVRLKGGDPFVFGRGGEEILACLKARHSGHGRAGGDERDRGYPPRPVSRSPTGASAGTAP